MYIEETSYQQMYSVRTSWESGETGSQVCLYPEIWQSVWLDSTHRLFW